MLRTQSVLAPQLCAFCTLASSWGGGLPVGLGTVVTTCEDVDTEKYLNF